MSTLTLPAGSRHRLGVVGVRIAVIVGFVVAWEVGTRTEVLDALTWSSPSAIVSQLGDLVGSPQIAVDVRSTLINILLGFGLGCVVGGLIGIIVAAVSQNVATLLAGYLVSFDAVPLLIFYPILLVIFGLNRLPVILVVAGVVVAPVAINTAAGLREIPSVLRRLARSLELSRVAAIRRVYLPAAVPLIFPGLRVGFLAALVSTIGMEFIVAGSGIGYRIGQSYHTFAVDQMYANIVLICVFAVGANSLLSFVERRLRRDMVG